MTQKYRDGKVSLRSGTVIISTVGECKAMWKTVKTALNRYSEVKILYIDFSKDIFKWQDRLL